MKTKKIIILVTLSFVGIFVWGYFSRGGTSASVQGVLEPKSYEGTLTVSEMFYDFGKISMKDGNVSKEFVVTNSSGADVNLRKIQTSCMCTVAFIVKGDGSTKGPFGMPGHGGPVPLANEIIKSGESRIINAVFDPSAHGPAGVGKIDRFITLTDGSGNNLQLAISALVTP